MAERDISPGPDGANPSGYPSLSENPSSGFEPRGASDGAKEAPTGLKQKMSEDASAARQLAKDGISQAADKAKETANEQKNIIAKQLRGVASAVEKAGSELQGGDQRAVGDMARRMGSSMRKFADDIKDRDLGQVAGLAEDFGRKQPAAFLGIAALAGFAASRFLAASGSRGTRNTGKEEGRSNG
ncbi:nutrient deprivation-induced protein [Neorhizobium sp. 2083]|uniref:nutrient deprivation-induced protein n=1 Tax=Neorhizobium sp. 2083 TaxID=2817762 RepID=UPI00286AE24C|nr:nutrient deprivation-induced protein [Neorhizobium sp. 2083]